MSLTYTDASAFSVAQLAVTHCSPVLDHAFTVGLAPHAFAKGDLWNHTAKSFPLSKQGTAGRRNLPYKMHENEGKRCFHRRWTCSLGSGVPQELEGRGDVPSFQRNCISFWDTCIQARLTVTSNSPSSACGAFTLVTSGASVASIASAACLPSDIAVAFPVHTVTH